MSKETSKLRPERERAISSLDKYRPMRTVANITEFDFAEYKRQSNKEGEGVTLLLDAEGTFVRHGQWEVDEDIKDYLKVHKEAKNIKQIAIITNAMPTDEEAFLKINSWAQQIGAELVLTPLTADERKPAPHMYLKALAALGVSDDDALVFGDKLTADIQGANAAGIRSVFVKRLGKEDLPGDRLLRRPIETLIHWKGKTKDASHMDRDQTVFEYPQKPESVKPDWMEGMVHGDELWKRSRIVGFGKTGVELPKDVLDNLPKGHSMNVDVGEILGNIDPKFKAQYDSIVKTRDAILYDHGRQIADTLTNSRLFGGPIVGGLILADRYDDAKKAFASFTLTDLFDGPIARSSEGGATAEGGWRDQFFDKVQSVFIETALAHQGRITRTDAWTRIGRDVVIDLVRKSKNKKGVDTKAVMAGKVAFFVQALSQFYAMTEHSQNNPRVNKSVQRFATGLKVASGVISPIVWEKRYKRETEDMARMEIARAELMVEAA